MLQKSPRCRGGYRRRGKSPEIAPRSLAPIGLERQVYRTGGTGTKGPWNTVQSRLTVIHKSSVAILYNRDRFQQNGAGDRWVARRRRKILGISESKVVLLEQIRPFRAAFLDLKSPKFPACGGLFKKKQKQGLFLSGLFLFSDSGKSVGGSCKTEKKKPPPLSTKFLELIPP